MGWHATALRCSMRQDVQRGGRRSTPAPERGRRRMQRTVRAVRVAAWHHFERLPAHQPARASGRWSRERFDPSPQPVSRELAASSRETLCEPTRCPPQHPGRGVAAWGRHRLAEDAVDARKVVGMFRVMRREDVGARFRSRRRSGAAVQGRTRPCGCKQDRPRCSGPDRARWQGGPARCAHRPPRARRPRFGSAQACGRRSHHPRLPQCRGRGQGRGRIPDPPHACQRRSDGSLTTARSRP